MSNLLKEFKAKRKPIPPNLTFKYSYNGAVYKSINSPIIKKVLEYYAIDGVLVNAREWNKEINTISALIDFVKKIDDK